MEMKKLQIVEGDGDELLNDRREPTAQLVDGVAVVDLLHVGGAVAENVAHVCAGGDDGAGDNDDQLQRPGLDVGDVPGVVEENVAQQPVQQILRAGAILLSDKLAQLVLRGQDVVVMLLLVHVLAAHVVDGVEELLLVVAALLLEAAVMQAAGGGRQQQRQLAHLQRGHAGKLLNGAA